VPVTDRSANDVVIDQIEAGYRFGDRLLRPAKVIVGRLAPRWH
jgi:molecular chaperone GrpE (heat shock protein)